MIGSRIANGRAQQCRKTRWLLRRRHVMRADGRADERAAGRDAAEAGPVGSTPPLRYPHRFLSHILYMLPHPIIAVVHAMQIVSREMAFITHTSHCDGQKSHRFVIRHHVAAGSQVLPASFRTKKGSGTESSSDRPKLPHAASAKTCVLRMTTGDPRVSVLARHRHAVTKKPNRGSCA